MLKAMMGAIHQRSKPRYSITNMMNMVIGNVDTLFLPSRPEHAHISSTIVRELIANKADVSAFVPKAVVLP